MFAEIKRNAGKTTDVYYGMLEENIFVNSAIPLLFCFFENSVIIFSLILNFERFDIMIFRRDYESIENLNDNKKRTLSGKQIILILSPVFVILMAITILFLLPTPNPIPNVKNLEPITKLNETYVGDLIITATDIKAINSPTDQDSIFIGVRFEVENNSSISYSLYTRTLSAYVDDVATDTITGVCEAYIDKKNEELFAVNMDPEKKTMGYIFVKTNKNSKKLEFIFDEPTLSGDSKKISFIFDIPPVEE